MNNFVMTSLVDLDDDEELVYRGTCTYNVDYEYGVDSSGGGEGKGTKWYVWDFVLPPLPPGCCEDGELPPGGGVETSCHEM